MDAESPVIAAINRLLRSGLNQAEVGRLVGVDRSTIGRWLDGGSVDLNRIPRTRGRIRQSQRDIAEGLADLDRALESLVTAVGTHDDNRGSPTRKRPPAKRRAS